MLQWHVPRRSSNTSTVKFFRFIVVVGCLPTLSLAQQASQAADTAEAVRQAATLSAQDNSPYTLQPGDEIEIRVYDIPELANLLKIRPDGKISVLLLNDVQAAGLTADRLSAQLSESYAQHYRSPKVTVIVRSFTNRGVFVGGEVGQPQQILLDGRLTASAALFRAGGVKESAAPDRILLIRNSSGAVPSVQTLDLDAVLKGKQDVELQPRDLLFVPKSTIQVYVGGEVAKPGLVNLQGEMTTVQALLQAGGMLRTGKLHEVLLLRNSGQSAPLLMKLNLKKVLAGEQDEKLHPFDVVYVPKTKIATINQVVDQYIRGIMPLYLNAGFNYLLGGRVF